MGRSFASRRSRRAYGDRARGGGRRKTKTFSLVRRDAFDARWVACSRPCVIAGGELTLDMLDLRYDGTGRFYEAPLHVKALGGCFVIDDFGHQLVSPTNLLNRASASGVSTLTVTGVTPRFWYSGYAVARAWFSELQYGH